MQCAVCHSTGDSRSNGQEHRWEQMVAALSGLSFIQFTGLQVLGGNRNKKEIKNEVKKGKAKKQGRLKPVCQIYFRVAHCMPGHRYLPRGVDVYHGGG